MNTSIKPSPTSVIAPIDKAHTQSANLLEGNLAQLKALFPEAFKEGGIDFEVLKQLLGGQVDEREEKYGLNWHGKRRARQIALTPSTGTLRPCVEDSVDWDTTQNLMIEGDNLEVLKLLQKSYAGKVKMIYIDPPYNTGKDFVYPDNFTDNIKNYLELTGQTDGQGRKLSSNTESSGRFHTDWLNMMYPRLKLAKNLLKDDSLICISIDDCERDNLKIAMDDIFGEENFIESVIWKKRYGGGAKEKHLVSVHEYILIYAKDASELDDLYIPQSQESIERYYIKRDDQYEKRGGYRTHPLEATKSMGDRPNLVFPIKGPEGVSVLPKRQWLWSKERVASALLANEIEFLKDKDGSWSAHSKQYLKDETGEIRQSKAFSIVDNVYSQHGTNELIEIFGDAQVFPFPKPTNLIRALLDFGANEPDCIVLDFFAGSGSTANALLNMNQTDQGQRRFVCVQLNEPISAEANLAAAEFCDSIGKPRNIAELTKERLRRAAIKIIASRADSMPANGQLSLENEPEKPQKPLDLGFKVFKLDTSNIRAWNPNPDELEGTLMAQTEHLASGRSEGDVLYEILLKQGLDLALPLQKRVIAGHAVHSVGAGALLVCLARDADTSILRQAQDRPSSVRTENVMAESSVTAANAEALALGMADWHAELAAALGQTPAGLATRVVLRDSLFDGDVAKTNLTAILRQRGLEDVRSL